MPDARPWRRESLRQSKSIVDALEKVHILRELGDLTVSDLYYAVLLADFDRIVDRKSLDRSALRVHKATIRHLYLKGWIQQQGKMYEPTAEGRRVSLVVLRVLGSVPV